MTKIQKKKINKQKVMHKQQVLWNAQTMLTHEHKNRKSEFTENQQRLLEIFFINKKLYFKYGRRIVIVLDDLKIKTVQCKEYKQCRIK